MYTQKQELYKISVSTGKVQVWSSWSDGGIVYKMYGQQNGKMQLKDYYAEPKNAGKANATTASEQAVVEVQADYQSQIDNKHYRLSVREAQILLDNNRVPRKVSKYKDCYSKMPDVMYSSIKKNGSRACVVDAELYSKAGRKEEVKVQRLAEAIDFVASLGYKNFDSEVYAHGLPLQRIRSAWLKPVKTDKEVIKISKDWEKATGEELDYNPNEDARLLKLHVFDVADTTLYFEDRIQALLNMQATLAGTPYEDCFEFIIPVETKSHEERMALLAVVYEGGYEGLVHYQKDDMYTFGDTSKTTAKSKPRLDSEAVVVNVTKDKNGEGLLHCIACDELSNARFKCKMKVKRRDGKNHPRDFDTMFELIGKWVTFSYEELSNVGIPQKPVGELERRCDASGEPIE